MQGVTEKINAKYQKAQVVDVKSGDSVRVHQKVVEGGKSRIQIYEGLVIKTGRQKSLSSTFTVRRIASGVGVEKSYLIHSPNIIKIEVTKRSKVRRNYLSYMRNLTGKSARLSGVDFDKKAVNAIAEPEKKPTKIEEQAEELANAEQPSEKNDKSEQPEKPEELGAEGLEKTPTEKLETKE
jgi:large subunit ribosomal protein L19